MFQVIIFVIMCDAGLQHQFDEYKSQLLNSGSSPYHNHYSKMKRTVTAITGKYHSFIIFMTIKINRRDK